MLINSTTPKIVGFEDELHCGGSLGDEFQNALCLCDYFGTLTDTIISMDTRPTGRHHTDSIAGENDDTISGEFEGKSGSM